MRVAHFQQRVFKWHTAGGRRIGADGEVSDEYKKLEKSQARLNEDLTQYMRLRSTRGGEALPKTAEEFQQSLIIELRQINKNLSNLLHLYRFQVSFLNGSLTVRPLITAASSGSR